MRSGSPSALRTTCFSHTFSTNVFGLSISVLPVLRVIVSLSTIVDREPVIFVSTPDTLETGHELPPGPVVVPRSLPEQCPSCRPPRHHVQANVIQGRSAVHRSHLLRHLCSEGDPLLLGQLL